MPPRVSVDTSVVGGVLDPAFATDSQGVFDEAGRGSLALLVGDVLAAELSASKPGLTPTASRRLAARAGRG
jgi:hypothetical protein